MKTLPSLERTLWMLGQVIAILALAYLGPVIIMWLTAIPYSQAHVQYGTYTPICPMVLPPSRHQHLPSCFPYDSISSSPFVFGIYALFTAAAILFLCYSTKLHRGLFWGRSGEYSK